MSSKTCFAKSSCIVLASALFCTSLPALATSSTAGTNLAVQQQDQKLKGQVIDATTGEPVIGVNVLVKGTTNGTITDIDGKYELNAPAGAILQISFIGYKTVEIAATTSEQTIKLHEDTETLDEVVVVGYGVQKKESLTGAMSTLKENRLKDVTTPTVENMLNGKVSGVYVAPGSGQPGSNGAVQIRGRATLSGSTSPLWVIDGVIVGEDPGVLNPSDIENMTILKDAASTAIYGSQGANGVIIVTTKMGKSEKNENQCFGQTRCQHHDKRKNGSNERSRAIRLLCIFPKSGRHQILTLEPRTKKCEFRLGRTSITSWIYARL